MMRSGPRAWLDGRVVLPLVLLVLTSVYLAGALRIRAPYQDEGVGASFFPIVLSLIMYAGIAAVLWNGLKEARQAPIARLRLGSALKVVLLTCVYVLLFRPLGYFLATTIYVYSLFFVFNFGSRNHLKRALVALLVAVAGFLLFETAFQVRLPKLFTVI